jgi:excisionase family DNA binding protein
VTVKWAGPPDHDPPVRMLPAREVAALFRVSPKTITQWARRGMLPHVRTLGGHRRYPETEVRAMLAPLGLPGGEDER